MIPQMIQVKPKHDKMIMVIGYTVGKTSLINRFVYDKFLQKPIPTIGGCYTTKNIRILGKIIKLEIWDIANSPCKDFYFVSEGAIFVYDISERYTFDGLQKWNEILSSKSTQTVFLLIGNKTDLTSKRQVSFDEGQRFAEENQMLFFECSAKTGENVERAFTEICIKIYQQQRIKKAVSSKNKINDAQNKNANFFSWLYGSKNAKPKTNSEITEKEAIEDEKNEKVEERIINDEIEIDDTIRKNNKTIKDKMKQLIKTTETTIEKMREDLDKKIETIESQMNIFINDLKEKDVKTDEYNETMDVRMNSVMNELKDLQMRICGNNDKMNERINQIINDINEQEVKIYQYIASIEHEIKERIRITETFIANTGEIRHARDTIIEAIRENMDKKMETIESRMNIFINDLKERNVTTDEYNDTVDLRMNNVMNELKDTHVRIRENNEKMETLTNNIKDNLELKHRERMNQMMNDMDEREVRTCKKLQEINERINEVMKPTEKTFEKIFEDIDHLQLKIKQLGRATNNSGDPQKPIFMHGEISMVIEDIFAKRTKHEIIDSKCFYGRKEPCKMSIQVHTNPHFHEGQLAIYLLVWHDGFTDQVKWPMTPIVYIRLKINKVFERLCSKLTIGKPLPNSNQSHHLLFLSYGDIFDDKNLSENCLTICVEVEKH